VSEWANSEGEWRGTTGREAARLSGAGGVGGGEGSTRGSLAVENICA
jgi:hypothetical protein